MRSRALALGLLSAALIAACNPRLEGARCDSDRNCPTEQTCVEGACIARCTLPCADGLVCGFQAGVAGCQCPPNDERTFYLDAAGGSRLGEAPFPTGVRAPAQCRFSRPSEALAQAVALANDGTGEPTSAVAVAGEQPETYEADTYPLEIPPGVTLKTEDEPPNPQRHVLSFKATAGDVVRLSGGTLSGFTVRNDSSGAPLDGVVVRCQNGRATLDGVRIEGTGAGGTQLVNGVLVDGCRLEARDTRVVGAQTGLLVERTPSLTWTTGGFEQSQSGVRVLGGTVLFNGVELLDNADAGLVFEPVAAAQLRLEGAVVARNGRVGVELFEGTSASTITGSVVSSSADGIVLHGGGLTLERSTATGNTGAGLRIANGSVAGGDVTLDHNGTGLLAQNGTVALERVSVVDNVGAGVQALGGALTFTGGAVSRNVPGVQVGAAVVALKGTESERFVFDANVDAALSLGGGSAQVQWADFRGTGVLVDQPTSDAEHVIQDSLFSAAPGTAPLVWLKSFPGPSGTVVLERNTLTGGSRGVQFGPGVARARLHGNLISGASDGGVFVNGTATSQLELTGNRVFQNDTLGTTPEAAGGVTLVGPPIPGFVFRSNSLYANSGVQLGVASGAWSLNGNCTTPNRFYCYAPSKVGVYVADAGQLDVPKASWANDPATKGTDYDEDPLDLLQPSRVTVHGGLEGGQCPRVTEACPE